MSKGAWKIIWWDCRHEMDGMKHEPCPFCRIQQLEEERRWESGSIQPPLCRPYLVHTSGVTVVMEWDGECWRGLDDGYIYAVTHWMKLPPPPKENNNDR